MLLLTLLQRTDEMPLISALQQRLATAEADASFQKSQFEAAESSNAQLVKDLNEVRAHSTITVAALNHAAYHIAGASSTRCSIIPL